jgi:hypothetical protein
MNQQLAKFVAAAAAVVLAAAPGAAGAQPDDDGFSLTLGYDGKLLFIKVLNMSLNEHVTRQAHESAARISSFGVLDAVKHFNIEAAERGPMVNGAPQPGVFSHQNHDGKRNRKVEVTWGAGDVTTTAEPELTYLGDPPATREQRLDAVGYLTAALRLTLAADRGPCVGAEQIFNGKELSQIGFADPRPALLSPAEKALGLVNPVRCNAVFKEVAGYKKKAGKARNQGLDRPIEVDFAQVGEGGPWVAARVEAHTQLGPALIELARVKVEGRLPEGLLQATR